ncbi:diguanylate cyclase [Floridanema aerugineum]|uniref:Diguanylate cyclase n=1 Tax=Floridaenema aerugineum BLCC-F46 TaxID=3153654 RepID=A0ABV4X7W8_9CYAN
MEHNQNAQSKELQLLEEIAMKSGELNQQLSIRETLVTKPEVEPTLLPAKSQLETQLAHTILELRQAYQEIQLQIIENERTQKLVQEQAELLDLVDNAILIRDLNNIISFWNQGAEKMYGFSKHEAIAKPYNTLLKTQFPRPLSEIEAKVCQKGYWEGELIHTKSDGTQIAVYSRWVLKRDGKNQPNKIIEINQDVTIIKGTEEALFAAGVRLAGILDRAKDAIISLDEKGEITLFNQGAENIFGYRAEEVLRQPIEFLVSFGSLENPQSNNEIDYVNMFHKILIGNYKIFGRHKNGREFPIEASASQLEFITGKVLTLILRDITERLHTEETLQETNERLTRWVRELSARNQEIVLLGEMSNILQACLTTEEAYHNIAQLIKPLFPNMSGAVFVMSNSKQLVSAVASWGDANATTEMIFTPNECWGLRRGRSHLQESSRTMINCKHRHHDLPTVESLCVPMMAQGEALGVLYLSATETGAFTQSKRELAITVAEQIALALANLKLHEALQQQSIRDSLTGLFNRRYLEESLEREVSRAERKQQTVGIIMLDIDHFKRFNDTFGHDAGDTVLRELGIFLKKNIRGSDIACRFGGEELLIILPEADLSVTLQRAEQIREGIKHLNLHSRNQQLGTITLSLGVGIFPQHGITGDMVIQAADIALYQAKAQGRDRVIVAS